MNPDYCVGGRKTPEDIAKVVTAEYNWQPDSLNMQWSLPGMMAELK